MGKTSVLIAEDHPETLEALQLTLQAEGFSVTPAQNGLVALRLLAQRKHDVLVTDLMMPEMNGIELIKMVRGVVAWKHLPVVVLSAYSNVYLMEAHRAGATVVLQKPRDLDRIVETIQGLLSRKVSTGSLAR